jgi:DNA repair protein RecN (Recombination protein N)
MLTSLKIENVAIIESAAVEFGCGLNVITGETGAGKSIVIDSINAILGERTSRELIRTGAESAKVYAVFEDVNERVKNILDENGIDSEEDVLIINRTINRDGKNICRINGCPVTVSMLKSIGRELIDIHGQHDSQALLIPESHCGFVDSFADCDELIHEYRTEFGRLCELKKQISSFNSDESAKAQRIDMLNYQIDELEKANIRVGEKEELTARKTLINNSQKVIDSLNAAYDALKTENGGIDMISSASNELERAGAYLEQINDTAQKISDMKYELEDAAEIIRDSLSELDYNPSELDEIEERLDLIYKLSRKYGETEEEMLSYLDGIKEELENISLSGEKTREAA